jgi:hypothetical protein
MEISGLNGHDNRVHLINIVLFAGMLYLFTILNIMPAEKPAVSMTEKRVLKAMPAFSWAALFEGSYTRGFEDYFADTFSFRERLVGLSSEIAGLSGLSPDGGVKIMPVKGDTVAGAVQDKASVVSAAAQPSNGESPIRDMLVLDDAAMGIYNFYPERNRFYADTIRDFGNEMGNAAKVYCMLVPGRFEFIKDKKYRDLGSSEKEAIDYIYGRLADGSVATVDAYKPLSRHADEYVYFRTDHHWTALGAYYAYAEFMKETDKAPVPLGRYDKAEVRGFLGSTYNSTLDRRLRDNPDTVIYYKPIESYTFNYGANPYSKLIRGQLTDLGHSDDDNKYMIFMGGDHAFSKITTDTHNGRKIIIIKDSYGNAFIPFLISHYEEIHVIDPRFGTELNSRLYEYIKENGIQEVLFLNYINAASLSSFTESIIKLIHPTE